METQVVTVSVFFKNKILEVRTIFEAISKQNKCKFLWLPNKKLIFRGLFISKFNFRSSKSNSLLGPSRSISNSLIGD